MAEKDRVYKCLNPSGIGMPVKTYPLAPHLDSIDGKEIWLSITGEPDITLPLEKRLKSDYPNVHWRTKRKYDLDPIPLTDEEMKTANGLIQAVCW